MTSFQDAEVQCQDDQQTEPSSMPVQSQCPVFCEPNTVTETELLNIQFRVDDIQPMLQQENSNIDIQILHEETQNFQQDQQHIHNHHILTGISCI